MSEDKSFTQEDVNRIVSERVKEIKAAKDAEIGLLRQEVKDWQAKASEFDTVAGEREALRKELDGIKLSAERNELFANVGVSDSAVRRRLEVLYSAEAAGADDAPSFADWLTAAREDATLSPWFGVQAASVPSPAADTPARVVQASASRPAPAVPSTSRGQVADPLAARRLNPGEVLREHARLLSAGQVKEAGEFLRANSAI